MLTDTFERIPIPGRPRHFPTLYFVDILDLPSDRHLRLVISIYRGVKWEVGGVFTSISVASKDEPPEGGNCPIMLTELS